MAQRSRLGEFERIADFLSFFPRARVPVGPGDDCAVLAPSKEATCITTDAVVDGVHFTREHFRPEDIGHKALAVNLSDLASMGAKPTWFLVAIALPRDFPERELHGLALGMSSLARAHELALVGGNFTAASELSVTITAAGSTLPGQALLRSGARPGDVLFVSGTLGDARQGLEDLRAQRRSACVERQRRPAPRVKLGLLARRYASAALDVSDGLAQDLSHLCTASGVGARVTLAALPTSDALRKHHGASAFEVAWRGGEDYELLLSVRPERAAAFVRACARAGEEVTAIGEITRGPTLEFEGPDGRLLTTPEGFDHFRPPGPRI